MEILHLKKSFYYFVKQSWNEIQTDEFIDGKYIKLLCDYFQAVYEGKVKDLIINIPPRMLKTDLSGVFWPAWVWARNPKKKFIFASYSQSLSVDASKKCRKLIESDWYFGKFPEVELDTTKEDYLTTTKGGHRISIGVDGTGTGRGADYFVADDLLKAGDAYSDTVREKTNKWYSETVSTRRNNLKSSSRIIICQRLHFNDVVGYVLEKEGDDRWEKVILPMEYNGPQYFSSIGLDDFRKEKNELLHPERFTREDVDDLKVSLGTGATASQLQQVPIPEGGAIFKKDWFNKRINNLDVKYRFLSFDTASTVSKTSAYSSCTVGELTSDYKLFIREVDRRKLEFPQLVEWIKEMAEKYKGQLDLIFIENKSSGPSAIQTLQQSSDDWIKDLIVPVNIASGDSKENRARASSIWCENGCVIFPPESEQNIWLLDFQEEIFKYPGSRYADQVDSFSQLVNQVSDALAEGLRYRKQGG